MNKINKKCIYCGGTGIISAIDFDNINLQKEMLYLENNEKSLTHDEFLILCNKYRCYDACTENCIIMN